MNRSLFSPLKRLAAGIFGHFQWSPPPWLRGLVRGSWHLCRHHPAALLITLLAAGTGTWGGVKWWQWKEAHRPGPDAVVNVIRDVSVTTAAPGQPGYDKTSRRFSASPLNVMFSAPTAPLAANTGANPPTHPAPVTGVTLDPALPGRWSWISESALAFLPDAPWPPGRKFTVVLSPSLALKPEVRLLQKSLAFTTAPLEARIGPVEFYIDPRDPTNQQVTAGIRVSHPVTQAELEKHLSLTVIGNTPLFTTGGPAWTLVTDNDDPRHVWLRSPKVIVPAKEDFAVITLKPGLVSVDGGEPLAAEVTGKIVVRDKFSGLSITEATGTLVPNEEGEPLQHLMISTGGFAKAEDLASRLEVRLLPAPAEEAEAETWDAPASIPAEVLAKAVPVKLTPVPAAQPLTGVHAFRLPPLAPGQLLVTVRKGLPGLGGYELEDDWTSLTSVPEFPRELEFTARGGLLSLEGERKLALKARGVSHIRYTVARIPAGQINHLASMTRGRFESPAWRTWAFTEENIAHVRRTVVPTGKVNDWQAVWNTFDFSSALTEADAADPDASRGMFFITAEAVEPRPKADGEADEGNGEESSENGEENHDNDPDWQLVQVIRSPMPPVSGSDDEDDTDGNVHGPSRFVLVTDMGLLVKENTGSTRDVFVQSIRQGGPAAGVTLSIVAKNGETIATATTADDGHAWLDSVESFTHDRKPVVLVARRGNDVAFLPLNRQDRALDFSRFDTGGLTSGGPGTLDAFVFTERGVYRPGDTVHASLIVRQRNGGPAPAGLPVTVIARNAAGRSVFEQTLSLPADGMLDCQGALRETDPTGLFTLQVLLFPDKPDPGLIGRTVFRVEDFQPDRMTLKADLPGVPESGWTTNPGLTAELDLQTLFGFPAAGRRITGKLTLAPADFSFAAWPDYTFHDRAPVNLTAGHERNLGEIKSGTDGRGKFDLGLGNLADASVAFTFTAEAFEPDSGRSVAVQKSGRFSPLTTLVGWKADGDLGYIGKDAPRRLHLVCLDPDLKPTASATLTQIHSITRHLSVLTKQESGSYAYVSTTKREELGSSPLTISSAGLDVALPTGETGDFRLEFKNPEGQIVAACDYTVTGKGDGNRSLEQNAELQMKLARSDWKSGENLEVSLTAPFTGAGLLTIEREKVLGWRWFKDAGKESIQTIPVPADVEGTAYVQAAFVRAADSPEVFMSPLSYAVQPFRANYDRRLIPLTLEVPERIRPGENLQARLTSPVPARAVIYAVDEGIHRITNYQLPKPRDFFLRPRALEVTTTQILDLLMPEFTILGRSRAFGGDGDAEDELTLNLNPFQRKRDAPVVYWSGLVSTGPQGVTVDYPVPDYFAGQLTFMAVAAGEEGYGSASAKTLVRGPFVLTPNAPVFAAPGDTFTLSLTVANNVETGSPAAVKVVSSLTTTPNIRITRSPEPMDIAPGQEGTVRFEVAVQEPLGNATLTFKTEAAGVSAERSVTLSVRPATPRLTTVQSGYFRQPEFQIKPQRQLYPEFAGREVSVAAVPLNLARGLSQWLQEFPHGCTEQLISRATPRLLLNSEASFGFDRAAAAADLTKVFAQLRGRQAPNGSFGTWNNQPGSGLDFLTVYAADFLTSAKEAGFAVPEDMLAATLKNLREMSVMAPASLSDQVTQARAIYLLARNGEVTTNYLLNLRDTLDKSGPWHTGPAALWVAATHALLRQDTEAAALLTEWKAAKKPAPRPWNFWQDQPLALNALDLVLLCRHFPETAGNFNYDGFHPILQGLEKAEFNTYSAACCIQALKAWSSLQKQSGIRTSLTELTATAPPRVLAPPGDGLLHAGFTEAATSLQFQLLKPDTAPDLGAFYQVTESGFDRALPGTVLRDGMEVTRRWTVNGQPVEQVKVGDSVRMEVLVRNLGAEALRDLAIVDLLPGGWEVEEGTLRPGPGGAPGADSVDMREDRNIFYCQVTGQQTQAFSYQIRPVCAGTFTVPPAFANSMYRPAVQARSLAGKITALPR